MIRWGLRRMVRAFGAQYRYDVSYMQDVLDISTNAGARLVLGPRIIQYPGPKAAAGLVAGAYLASTLDGDCGPCAQLVIDMALAGGCDPDLLRACVEGRAEAAGDVGLGFRFAQAAIAGLPETDALAARIRETAGAEALVAASFGAAMGRFYPVFKRGMGHGAVCERLAFGGTPEALVAHG